MKIENKRIFVIVGTIPIGSRTYNLSQNIPAIDRESAITIYKNRYPHAKLIQVEKILEFRGLTNSP